MKKQLLLIVLLLSVTASAFAEEVEINGLWYEVVAKGNVAKVIKYKDNVEYKGNIVIPETVVHKGVTCSVTSIGDFAFSSCALLTSITIPNSVTDIEYSAFWNCFRLSSVTFSNSVKYISGSTFYHCKALTSVTIPNSVTSIGEKAFEGCTGLISVTIGSGVMSIGKSAFEGCSGLTSVTIGSRVNSISSYAFSNCPELAEVTCYAETVPSTSSNAFMDSYIEYTTLHVPTTSIDSYKTKVPWSQFKEIKGIGGDLPKCATPTIAIVGGKLTFDCETDDVTYKWSYSYDGDKAENEGKEVVLGGKTICHVTVYAAKEGYENSDTATCDVELAVGKKGDTNADGQVDVEDVVQTVNIILGE